ncbi:hypothetical protein ACA910_011104 [Epithemia clementina (nom. ined.)]
MKIDDEKIKAVQIQHGKFVDCLSDANNAWLLWSALPHAANTMACGHVVASKEYAEAAKSCSKELGEAAKACSTELGEAAKVSSEAAKTSAIILGVAAVGGAAVVGGSAVAAAFIIARR